MTPRFLAKTIGRGFPGSSVVKNLPLQEIRVQSHMPWNNLTYAPQLLSLCSRAWGLQPLNPCATSTETHTP